MPGADLQPLTPRLLSSMARDLYSDGPFLFRALQRFRPYICPFEELLPEVPRGASVLDIGCGGGLFLGLLEAAGKQPLGVGFDLSQPAIALAQRMSRDARKRRAESRLSFETVEADSPWPEGLFDVVAMIDVIHHVPPGAQEQVIRDACKRVRLGGLFLYKDMVSRPRWRAAANQLHDLLLARQWVHHLPPEQVAKWAVDEGLQVERAQRINRFWYGHELRLFKRAAEARAS